MRIVLAVVCLMWPGRAFAQEMVLLVGGSDALETALRLELAPQGLACARLESGTASLTLQEARAHAERHGAQAVIWVAPIEERVHVAWVDGGASEARLPGVTTPRSVALVASGLLDDARAMPALPRRSLTPPGATPPRRAVAPIIPVEPPAPEAERARPEPFTRAFVRAVGGIAVRDDASLGLARVSAGAWFRTGPRLGATAIAFLGELRVGSASSILGGALAGLELGWAWEWGPVLIALQASGQIGVAEGATTHEGVSYAAGAQLLLGVDVTTDWGIIACAEILAVGLEGSALALGVASVGVEWVP